jgi:hypothetical protein
MPTKKTLRIVLGAIKISKDVSSLADFNMILTVVLNSIDCGLIPIELAQREFDDEPRLIKTLYYRSSEITTDCQ